MNSSSDEFNDFVWIRRRYAMSSAEDHPFSLGGDGVEKGRQARRADLQSV